MSSGDAEAGESQALACCFPEGSGEKSFGAGGGGGGWFAGEDTLLGATPASGVGGGVRGACVCLRQEQTPEEGEGNAESIPPPPPQPRHEHWGKRSWGKRRAKEAVLLGEEGTGEVANKA